jgi:hypothetical protein
MVGQVMSLEEISEELTFSNLYSLLNGDCFYEYLLGKAN